MIFKKNGEFKKGCSSADPYTGEKTFCHCSNKSVYSECKEGKKYNPLDINKELLDAMRIIARQEIERCNRDITKTARVINVNNDKAVKIEMDGKQYDNIPNYNGTTLTTNDELNIET